MNSEKLKELAEQAANNFTETFRWEYCQQIDKDIFEKFAELIVKECVELGKELQTQDVINGSDDYNLGREMGIEVFMNQMKKRFGTE